MPHYIIKLCVDSLRAYVNDKHGIKLKASHAHEIVAAFFGYRSRAAMLADAKHSLANLEKSDFIVLNPPTPLVDQRLKELDGLSPDLPAGTVLAEPVYRTILAEPWLLEKLQPTFHDLAVLLAEEPVYDKLRMLGIKPDALQWITDVKGDTSEDGLRMSVTFDQDTGAGKRSSYATVEVRLSRVAGHIGYGRPKVMPTFYSGQMRDPDFRLKHGNF